MLAGYLKQLLGGEVGFDLVGSFPIAIAGRSQGQMVEHRPTKGQDVEAELDLLLFLGLGQVEAWV